MTSKPVVSPIKEQEVIVRLGGPARTLVLQQSALNGMSHRQTAETILLQWQITEQGHTLGRQIIDALTSPADGSSAASAPVKPAKKARTPRTNAKGAAK